MEKLDQTVIKGYEILERIGTGGFGAVYKAYQSTIGREVAIKIILPGFANHPDFIRRFETEAHVIARLEHPHIVPLYDYWRDTEGAYLVMRWLRGGSLREKLQRDGAIDPTAAALLIDQLATGLDLAHRHDVIHRDIKPANILLDEDENAYLADFGIAKDLADLNKGFTGADDIVGSLDYISPEQARSDPVTPRTDIYSLGVMLYEMLVGKHPFQNMSALERLHKHINDPLPEITVLDLNIRSAVNEVIQKATAKDPNERFQAALAFAAAFRQAVNVSNQLAAQLTQREHQVLQKIAEGLSYKQIASELFITVGTVKSYIKQVYRKLGVRSRVQATLRAQELNLLGAGIVQSISQQRSHSNLPEPENPYKGLRAFDAADHRDFFGRENLIQKLIDKMNDGSNTARFLAIVSPSGSGKSSLVKAGLIPAIWNGHIPGSDRWFTIDMLPGVHPMEELEVALTRVSANPIVNLDEHLWRDQRGLLRAAKLILPADETELLLVIDQFEEVFTHVDDEAERQQFLDILQTAVSDTRSRVRVVVTMRADFYDRPLHYPDFGDLLHSRMETILPLSAKGLERAIVGPAERVQVTFEEGLVAHIVSEMTYQASALPLLQYALTELFEQREGRVLTHEAYLRIGGAVGALAKRAETLFKEMKEAHQNAARQMFLRLVTLGEGTGDTRRRVTRSELLALSPDSDIMDEVIDIFATHRMLSLDHDPITRSPTVEVAHEAILGQWERLRNWINHNREEIKMQQQLTRMAEEWQHAHQDPSYLASGLRLGQMEGWAQETQMALSQLERQFLETSITERNQRKKMEAARKEREVTLEAKSVQRLRLLVAVFVVATVVAAILAAVAMIQRNEAENARATSEANVELARQQADENRGLYLTNEAQEAARNGDNLLALALSLEAVRADNISETANQILNEMVWQSAAIRRFEGHTNNVTTLAYSPDGRTAISGSFDRTLILWNLGTGEIIQRFEGHTGGINEVAFSPDGQTVISASSDKTLILWDVTTGEIIHQFEGSRVSVTSVAFSPDGQTILSGSCGSNVACPVGEVILWDVTTGSSLSRAEAHDGLVISVAFSPDGQQAVSISHEAVFFWNIADHMLEEPTRLFDTFTRFENVSFNLNGSWIFVTLRDGSLVRQTTSGVGDGRLVASGIGTSPASAFSPDFRTFLSAVDNTLRLRSATTGATQSQYMGHTGAITAVAVSIDGQTFLSGSSDNTIILWDANSGNEAIRTFAGHQNQTWGLAVSPDGQTLLGSGNLWLGGMGTNARTASDADNSLIVWDTSTGEILQRMVGHDNGIFNVVISPDGRLAVTASDDGTMGIWDIESGTMINRFAGLPSIYVAISPDGETVLSNADGQNPVLWDIETGEVIWRFPQTASTSSGAAVAFSPDGQYVAVSVGSDIVLADIATGDEISRFTDIGNQVHDLTFSPDSRALFAATGESGALYLGVETNQILGTLINGDVTWANGVAISPDGTLVVTAWGGGNVILWNLASDSSLLLGDFDEAAWRVAFSPDGSSVYASSLDGTVRQWLVPEIGSTRFIEWVEDNRYIREFTCEERAEYRIEPFCDSEDVEG